MARSSLRRSRSSALVCAVCGERVPLDVTRIRVEEDEAILVCTSCGASVPVPVFGGEWEAEAPDPEGLPDDGEVAPEPASPAEAAPAEAECADEAVREERREAAYAKANVVACRSCGADVTLDGAEIRLTLTHASLTCRACEAEVRVRRSDAFRDVDVSVAWTFAAYAVDEDPEEVEPSVSDAKRPRRLFKRTKAT